MITNYRFNKPIWAIIGGGNGGQAVAGHLALLGFRVRLYDIFTKTIEVINKQGGIQIDGVVEGLGKLELATNNISSAISGADFIMVIAPATAHASIAKSCAPYLRNGQIVMLHPGNICGALEFKKVLDDEKCNAKITLADSHSLIYACRSIRPGQSTILQIKDRFWVGTMPTSERNKVVGILKMAYPQTIAVENILIASLENTNCIIHPPTTLFNVGLIESKDRDWLFYWEGITKSIGSFIEDLDKERLAIGQALGFGDKLVPVVQQYALSYSVVADSLYQAVRLTKGYREIKGQKTLRTRYLLEDIPMGLVTLMSIGKMLGVPVERMELLIKLAEFILKEDLTKTGRTIEKIGLAGMSSEQIMKYVRTGIKP